MAVSSLRASLSVLRDRNFRLLFTAHAASNLGNAIIPIALPFAVLDMTGSVTAVGMVLLASHLPVILFVLGGGVLGDRVRRERLMIYADIGRALVQAMTAALLLTGEAEIWHLIALQALAGLGAALFEPAATGIIPQVVAAPDLQPANSLVDMSRSTAKIFGHMLGGVIVATAGPAAAFAVDALTFVVSAVALMAMRVTRWVRPATPPKLLADLRAGWDEFRSRTWLWLGVAHMALFNAITLAPFFVLGPFVFDGQPGGRVAWAAVATMFTIGAVSGGAVALVYRPRRPVLVAFAAVLGAIPQIALLAAGASPGLVIAAAFLGGAQSSFFGALWATAVQEAVPEESLSRVSSYGWLGGMLFVPLGYALAGPLSEAIGVSATLWLAAGWAAVSTLAVMAVSSVREVRRSAMTSDFRAVTTA